MREGKEISIAFVASILASVALGFVYIKGGNPQLEGAFLGLALGGLAIGIVLWAVRFMPKGGEIEVVEPLGTSEQEKQQFTEEFGRGAEYVSRRKFLARLLGAAVGALGLAALFPIRSLGPRPGLKLFETSWRAGSRLVTGEGVPVKVGDLDFGSVLTVFPEGHTDEADAQTLLIRMRLGDLQLPDDRADWVVEGHVAYSKICTHAGCPVGLYEHRTKRLYCPCHQSVFDAGNSARPITGPATRALPQLPIGTDDEGYLIALGDYREPVGAGFWNRDLGSINRTER